MPADSPGPRDVSDEDVVRLTGIIAWQRIAMGAILALLLLALVGFVTRGMWDRERAVTPVETVVTPGSIQFDPAEVRPTQPAGSPDDPQSALAPFVSTDDLKHRKWVVHTTSKYLRAPVAGPDGMVYVYTRPSTVYAIASDGTVKWRHRIDEFNVGQILPMGKQVLVQTEKYLEVVGEDGNVSWTYDPETDIKSVAAGPDGEIYVCVANERTVKTEHGDWDVDCCYVAHLDAKGRERWRFDAESSVAHPIICTADGNMILSCDRGLYTEDAMLHCISSGGALRWKATNRSKFAAPMVTDAGLITQVWVPGQTEQMLLRCYDRKGTVRWEQQLALSLDAQRWELGGDRLLVEANSPRAGINKELVMLDSSSGRELWRAPIPEPALGAPALDDFGNLWVAAGKRDLICIDGEGHEKATVDAGTVDWVGTGSDSGQDVFAVSTAGITALDPRGNSEQVIELSSVPLAFAFLNDALCIVTATGEIAALDPHAGPVNIRFL